MAGIDVYTHVHVHVYTDQSHTSVLVSSSKQLIHCPQTFGIASLISDLELCSVYDYVHVRMSGIYT